jgi:drug/metabolite transporter (DMT)-like permease
LPIQAIPYILLLGTLFGTTLIASRFSVGQFESSTYIGLRLVLASLGYLIVAILPSQRHKWPADRSLWRHAAIIGILGTAIPMNFLVASLKYQSSGMTSILITLGPAITVVIAHFFLPEESLTKRKIAGVVIALCGALLLVLLGETGLPDISQTSSIGYLLVFSAMVCASISVVYTRKFMSDLDSIQVASLRNFIAAVVVMPLSILFVGFDLSNVNQQGFFALGWAALAGTFLGMLVSFYNIKRFGATAAAMTAYVIPVVASIGGYLILDETITTGMVAGMALIVVGIAIINQRSSQIKMTETI